MEACWPHNPEVGGSKPRSATNFVYRAVCWDTAGVDIGHPVSVGVTGECAVTAVIPARQLVSARPVSQHCFHSCSTGEWAPTEFSPPVTKNL